MDVIEWTYKCQQFLLFNGEVYFYTGVPVFLNFYVIKDRTSTPRLADSDLLVASPSQRTGSCQSSRACGTVQPDKDTRMNVQWNQTFLSFIGRLSSITITVGTCLQQSPLGPY